MEISTGHGTHCSTHFCSCFLEKCILYFSFIVGIHNISQIAQLRKLRSTISGGTTTPIHTIHTIDPESTLLGLVYTMELHTDFGTESYAFHAEIHLHSQGIYVLLHLNGNHK